MSLISFDIGIKNMAYCIFLDNNPNVIQRWDVLNLMEKEESIEKCTNSLKPKNKIVKTKSKKRILQINTIPDSERIQDIPGIPEISEIPEIICNKLAKYTKLGIFYCEKCAKSQTEFILPKKQYSGPSLKKMKIEPLETFAKTFILEIPKTKRAIIDVLMEYFERRCLDPIIEKKGKSAGETDLITIGRNMKTLLDQIPELDGVKTVIIENQISTIATRMKSIQAMLAQTFIMRNPDIEIEFVSSSNKLKGFILESTDITGNREKPENQENREKSKKQIYKQHKMDGIRYTSEMIEKSEELKKWAPTFHSSKKKDDLADAFLQGIWFLKKEQK
jgi:hypothetical protein